MKKQNQRVIAVTGKGGVGKSAFVALMCRILAVNLNNRILAIDADSAMSLSYTLGIDVGQTISQIRNRIIEDPETRKEIRDQNIRDVIADIVNRKGNIDLLVMGRPEDAGCFCAVNDLLKYGIQTLTENYAVSLIDGEAGPEQINRRVLQNVDDLVIVADTSLRSIKTAASIRDIAINGKATASARVHLVINRFTDSQADILQIAADHGFSVAGTIPDDIEISRFDLAGEALLNLSESSASLDAVEKIIAAIDITKCQTQ